MTTFQQLESNLKYRKVVVTHRTGSLAVRLPAEWVQRHQVKRGDALAMFIAGNSEQALIILKSGQVKPVSLKQKQINWDSLRLEISQRIADDNFCSSEPLNLYLTRRTTKTDRIADIIVDYLRQKMEDK